MNYLNSFFMSFCVSAIFIGGIFIICPNGKMSKPIKYILCLIFTVIIIVSVSKINPDFNLPYFESQISEQNSDKLQIQSAEYVWGACLNAANIKFTKITVCTNKTQNNSIVISKVMIFSNESKENILNALGDLAKAVEVEIINE